MTETVEETYELTVDVLAPMLASHCSERPDSIPEQEDFDLAQAVIDLADRYYNSTEDKKIFQIKVGK